MKIEIPVENLPDVVRQIVRGRLTGNLEINFSEGAPADVVRWKSRHCSPEIEKKKDLTDRTVRGMM